MKRKINEEVNVPISEIDENVAARFENVTFVYSKGTTYETTAVDGITLDIYKGKITGIIGATGSGKSTLIQMLNGLIKPDSGRVFVDGIDIHSKKVKMRDVRFKVGLVMQYPEYQLFDETVYSDIAFGPKNMGIDGEELEKRVLSAARFAGVTEDLLNKSPFELSGGQKRRAALAGVIAMHPSVLVLDEPAAGLDPVGRKDILDGIKAFQRESGISVVIVSHSMEDMAKYCDRLVVISNGRVLMNDEKENVFSRDEELTAAGLDVPQITRVAKKLDELGIHISDGVYTVNYAAEKLVEKFGL